MQSTLNIKEELHQLADQLPKQATWKDVAYEVYVREQIAAGIAAAQRGEFASDNELKDAFSTWGVHIATEVD